MSHPSTSRAALILQCPACRKQLSVQVRSWAKRPGFIRIRLESSCKETSRTWRQPFSMDQWPRTSLAASCAVSARVQTYQDVSCRLRHACCRVSKVSTSRSTRISILSADQPVSSRSSGKAQTLVFRRSIRLAGHDPVRCGLIQSNDWMHRQAVDHEEKVCFV